MDATEYQKLAIVTENTPNLFGPDRPEKILARLLHGAIGLCTETGELQDALKKHLFYGRDLDLVNIAEEAGDAAWYLAIVADALGDTLGAIMARNIAKLKLRYPGKFDAAAERNRDLVAERAALEDRPLTVRLIEKNEKTDKLIRCVLEALDCSDAWGIARRDPDGLRFAVEQALARAT